jgi:hypothetical protein
MITSIALISCVATTVVLAATGCREFDAYAAIGIVAAQALFIRSSKHDL